MPTQLMTYAELAEVWGVSREAARKKVEGLRLPRQTGNDGKARVMIDLAEVQHQPLKPKETGRKAPGDRAEAEALRAHVETLQAEIGRLTALVGTNRADFERERDRAEKHAAEVIGLIERLGAVEKERAEKTIEAEKALSEAETARAALAEWKAQPWWRRAFG